MHYISTALLSRRTVLSIVNFHIIESRRRGSGPVPARVVLDKMNILFVSITVPYPAVDGGRIRVLNLSKQLVNQRDNLTFVALRTKETDPEGIKYLQNLGIDAHLVEEKIDKPKFLYHATFHRKPFTVAKYYSDNFARKLNDLIKEKAFDIIHFEMLHGGQYLGDLEDIESPLSEKIPTLLSLQNIDSIVWKRLAEYSKNRMQKIGYRHQARAFSRYEKKMCRKFNTVTCVSEIDRNILSKICPQASIDLVPNGVDLELYKPKYEQEKENMLIFTGSMDWLPNEDAAVYFTQQMLPLIKSRIENVKFYIVGSNPTERVLKLDKQEDVIVTGRVDDIKPYIAQATVYVVPLRIGGGTRLKILEALAIGKAVVSTSVGAEGLDLSDGVNIFIAEEPTAFAEIVTRLMKHQDLCRQIGMSGRGFVEEEYSWSKIGKKLRDVYERTIHLS